MKNRNINLSELKKMLKKQRFSMSVKIDSKKGIANRSIKYIKISKLLEDFGLCVDFPLETMPLEYDKMNKEMQYISYYPVKGTIDEDSLILNLEELEVRILKESEINNPCPNPKKELPYLLIEISGIKLPWILEEEIE